MQKKNLILRAEQWRDESKKMPLIGYLRNNQPEILEISAAIIKAICTCDNVTTYKAVQALKIAADIIEEEKKFEIME